MAPDTSDSFARELLASLVRIPSVNPRFCGPRSGPSDERELARYVHQTLSEMGLETDSVGPAQRPSVVGRLRGTGGGRSLMLNGHLDTVGVETMGIEAKGVEAKEGPFSAHIDGNRLYGRGSYDMKGGLAAAMAAVRRVLRRTQDGPRLRGDVVLTAVADEEDASLGTRAVLEQPHLVAGISAALVTEPTGLDLAVAHRGFAWIRARTTGFACHGSLPDRGVDANRHMGRVIQAIEALDAERQEALPDHPLLGRPSLHIGRIEGGLGPSIYSPSCELTLELRTLPGETGAGLLQRLDELLAPARETVPRFDVELELELERPPLAGRPEGSFTRRVQTTAAEVLEREPPITGLSFWTDAALIEQAGIETVLLGPAGQGAHEDVEWVDLDSIDALTRILERVILDLCS